MLIYSSTNKEFKEYVSMGIISDKVYDAYKEVMGKKIPLNQIKAWANSLPFMKEVLEDIPDTCGIAIEYGIPLTSKRIDFMISGYDKTKKPVVVILELKQWEYATDVKNREGVVKTLIKNKEKICTHPAYQVCSYKEILENFNFNIEKEQIKIIPFVFLHNYDLNINDDLFLPKFKKYYGESLMFGKNDSLELKKTLEDILAFGDNLRVIHMINDSQIKPNKKLLNVLNNMLQSKKEFTLLDEQKEIMEEIKIKAREAFILNKKQVIIVKGGPGTGKSVLALQTLGEMLNIGLIGAYVSKNMAPRKVYKNKLSYNNQESMQQLFKSSSNFFNDANNKYDFLLVDEAHRLQEKSGVYNNLGENQIKEIIHAAKLSVFFVDEKQIITLKDIGTINNITYFAKKAGAYITTYELKSQFRCNGSENYLDFVEAWLYNKRYKPDYCFDFKVMNSPLELYQLIKEKNTDNNARIVAGYCWNRKAGEADNQNYYDIKIDDFEMSWNLKHGEDYAIRENAINEVGCVHNVQGLEFDYIGVIIGPDLKYREGKVVTDYKSRANTEKSLYGLHVLIKKDKIYYENLADLIIRNTYRVLLTRGIKGCYVYASDANLQKYLKKICSIHVKN